MTSRLLGAIALACLFALPAFANETVKAGQIDPALHGTRTHCDVLLNVQGWGASVEPDSGLVCETKLKVVNLDNGETVTVTVIDDNEDAGDGLTIKLTPAAAELLDMKATAKVLLVPLRSRARTIQ